MSHQADIDRAVASMTAETSAVEQLIALANQLAQTIRDNATDTTALLAAADAADAEVAKIQETLVSDAPPAV